MFERNKRLDGSLIKIDNYRHYPPQRSPNGQIFVSSATAAVTAGVFLNCSSTRNYYNNWGVGWMYVEGLARRRARGGCKCPIESLLIEQSSIPSSVAIILLQPSSQPANQLTGWPPFNPATAAAAALKSHHTNPCKTKIYLHCTINKISYLIALHLITYMKISRKQKHTGSGQDYTVQHQSI